MLNLTSNGGEGTGEENRPPGSRRFTEPPPKESPPPAGTDGGEWFQVPWVQGAILDAIPARIALLNEQGVIVAVNQAWLRFAGASGLAAAQGGVGLNYCNICAAAPEGDAPEAAETGRQLGRLLAGAAAEFTLDYPCHSPTEPRWFRLMATALRPGVPGPVLVTHVDITERRRTEETLRGQEAAQRRLVGQLEREKLRLEAAQAVGRVGSWETDLATMAVVWSAETHRIFETIEGVFQVTHGAFLERVHPEDREPVQAAFLASLPQVQPCSVEHRIQVAGGRTKFVEERWQVFRNDSGRPVRAIGTCQDISERHAADAALRASEASLARAQAIAHLGSWELDLTGPVGEAQRRLTWSDEVCRIFGVAPGRFGATYEAFLALVHPEDHARLQECQRRALAGEAELNLEHRIVRPNGIVRWVLEQGELQRDARGQPVRLVGTVLDITVRKQAAEERDRLFNLSLDLLCVVGFDGKLEQINPAWTACLGWSAGELTGRDLLDLVHPGDRDGAAESLERLAGGETVRGLEIRCRHRDGSYRWLSWNSHPLRESRQVFAAARDVTAQKNTSESLELSQSLLRIAGRAARLGGWALELSPRKLLWSDETCAIHDLPPGYQPALEEGLAYFPPEHRAEVERLVEACARDGTPYEFELPKATATGRKIWVRSVGEAVRNAAGEIYRLQGAFQDITERKRVELELFKSNRALRMLRACGEALTKQPDESLLLAEVCRLAVELGKYRLAWVGYALEDAERTIQPMAQAGVERGYLAKARLSWSADHPAGRGPAGRAVREGSLMYCPDIFAEDSVIHWREEAMARGYRSMICLPLRDERRAFGLLGLYSSDLDPAGAEELKLLQELADDLAFGIVSLRARAAQRAAVEKLAQQAELLDKATDAIFVRDLAHRVTYWNRGAERVYGWKAGEVAGQTTRDLLHGDPFAFEAAMLALLKNGEWAGELEKKSKAGRLIRVDCRWTLVRNAGGVPQSVLAIETDVTEKKQIEAQFLRTQRMESLGTLASGIAHDLNNVLAPIMISIQILKRENMDEETGKLLGTLEICSRRGADLVKQVLSFARGVETQRVAVNPAQLARELHQVINDVFPKNIVTDFTAPEAPWLVTGDPSQLHQVLLNLCINARDAMPRGGRLSIIVQNLTLDETYTAANPEAVPGDHVMISVADSGAGIPAAIRDRIFEPFFTTKDMGKGTGLGLSTVLGIVKSHGGFIQVYSDAGQGTQFKVYLPAAAKNALAPAPAGGPPGLPRGQGELILLVDDESSIRTIAQKTLERFGYEVLAAVNGAEAVALYAQHERKVALVLTDISMPIMDGTALITALKSINPDVRIIASSGLTTHGPIAMDLGVSHFISKPYTTETLLQTLREHLSAGEKT